MSLTAITRRGLMILGLLTVLASATACGDGGGGPASFAIVVNSAADSDERDGALTLREAIALATGALAPADLTEGEADNLRGTPGADSADVIGFDPQVFPPAEPVAIDLTSTLPPLNSGDDIIDGAEAGVIIDGGEQGFECLILESSGNAIRGLQIRRCHTSIWLKPTADDNIIGGPKASQRNVITENANVGIRIDGSGNVVQGNYLGTDPTGTEARPNGMEGIWIAAGATDNLIGGSGPGEGNLISGNSLYGINIGGAAATGNTVLGNYIGVDASGETALQNLYGLVLSNGAYGNTIGGVSPDDANVISGNQSSGILIRGADTRDNVIVGNLIGTDASGENALSNGTAIWLLEGTHGNAIGGTELGQGNVIAHSRIFGVQVEGADTVGNTIRGNSIHSSAREGIVSKDGGNRGLSAPTITAVGPVTGTACPNCVVDIYSDAGDEGEVYEGSTTADAAGNFTFEGTLTGPSVTATATDADAEGNTSPFSEPRAVPSP